MTNKDLAQTILAVEKYINTNMMLDEIERLQKSNAELLEMCELASFTISDDFPGAVRHIDTAIANAKKLTSDSIQEKT